MITAFAEQLYTVFFPPQFLISPYYKTLIFWRLIIHIIRRGRFDAGLSSTTLYFKGIQQHAPQTLQIQFYSFNHQSLFCEVQIDTFKFSYALIHFAIISIASSR